MKCRDEKCKIFASKMNEFWSSSDLDEGYCWWKMRFLFLKWTNDECWFVVDWSYPGSEWYPVGDNVVILDISDGNNGFLG